MHFRITPSLPLLPGPLWPRVVAPVKYVFENTLETKCKYKPAMERFPNFKAQHNPRRVDIPLKPISHFQIFFKYQRK